MLSKVTAKNVGDVFVETHCSNYTDHEEKYNLRTVNIHSITPLVDNIGNS